MGNTKTVTVSLDKKLVKKIDSLRKTPSGKLKRSQVVQTLLYEAFKHRGVKLE